MLKFCLRFQGWGLILLHCMVCMQFHTSRSCRPPRLITSNYYLPSTSKDQSTMSVELTDLLHIEVDVIFGAHKARSNWEITRTGLSSTG